MSNKKRLSRLLGGKIESRSLMFKMALMGTIAEGLVLGLSAAAKADDLATGEPIRLAIAIYDLEISFNLKRAVVVDGDFCGHFRLFERRENR